MNTLGLVGSTKRTLLASFVAVALGAVMSVGAPSEASAQSGADPSGTWAWTEKGHGGHPDKHVTGKLAVANGKVTGAITHTLKDGKVVTWTIESGSLSGDEITFSAPHVVNGNTLPYSYKGKVTATEMTGREDYTQNGEPVNRNWTAKRVR